jgi:pyrroline-5-carboxylate reductase
MTLEQRKIAFIGGGHITNIIIDNLTRTQTAIPEQLIVSDPNKKRLETLQSNYGIVAAKNNLDAVAKGDFIFINVLPQTVDEVIKEFKASTILANKVIITLAAGIPMKKYSVLGDKVVMCLIG